MNNNELENNGTPIENQSTNSTLPQEPLSAPITEAQSPLVQPEQPSTQEMQAVSLGEIKEAKGGNVIGVVLFLIIAIGMVIALPYLDDIKAKLFSSQTNENNNGNVSGSNNNDQDPNTNPDTVEYYDIQTADFVFDGLKYSAFNLSSENDYNITFNVMAAGKMIDLSKQNLFIEIYTEDQTLLERAKVLATSYITAEKNTTITVSIQESTYNVAKKINIISMTKDSYPEISLSTDEPILTCTYQNNIIKYTFEEEKLININDLNTYYSGENSSDYYNALISQREAVDNLSGVEGINATLTQFENNFVVSITLDLAITSIARFDNVTYFAKNTLAKQIKYDMEAMRYTCR